MEVPIKLVSVSRQGAYSAVKNIGSEKTDNSYVIYADYTGTAADSSKISTSPDAVITAGPTALTGDGAAMGVRDTIIKDTVTTPSLMKGHYGADQDRSLDKDFPVLILNAATTTELNRIVDSYISMLTNDTETQKKHNYTSIVPTTYRYAGSAWTAVSSDEQTMGWSTVENMITIKIRSRFWM